MVSMIIFTPKPHMHSEGIASLLHYTKFRGHENAKKFKGLELGPSQARYKNFTLLTQPPHTITTTTTIVDATANAY